MDLVLHQLLRSLQQLGRYDHLHRYNNKHCYTVYVNYRKSLLILSKNHKSTMYMLYLSLPQKVIDTHFSVSAHQ